MKGLFVRDAIWLGKQRMLLVCMLALTVFYLFSDLHAFGVAFLPLMLAMLVCRTVQNDVSRACRRMFFTMPFNTRDYLIEKYCGAIIPPMLLSLVLMALGTLSPQMAWNQVPVALVMVLATVSVTVAVEIPIILAFRDRAAVMRIVAMAVIFTICVLVVSVTNNQDILVALTSIPDGLLMLIGGLAGIAAFEACSGVLMGAVLGLSSMTVSILFILPIPAAFFGAWFAGRPNKRFSTLMWQSVICCLLAGLLLWIPDWFGVMNVWTLLVPAALFFFGAGMLFPLATSGAMEPFPFLAGTAGALVGGLQNIGSGVLASLSAMLPQTGQGSLGLLMTLMGLLIVLCWLPLATRMSHQGQPV